MARVAFEYTERLRTRGHDVQVFSPLRGDDGDGQRDPSYVHRLRATAAAGNAALMPSLPLSLRTFDIVHVHYPFYGGAEPIARARSTDRTGPIVLSYHMDATADGLKGRLFDVHRRALQPWILAHADHVLVSSRDYADSSALAREPLRCLPIVCSFGVDTTRFQPGSEPALRKQLGIEPAVPVTIFVGSLDAAHRFKGLDVLFMALSLITDRPWHLLVVGGGNERAELERATDVRGIRARVTFAGDVSDELLPSYYRVGDVHVLPSTGHAEAFGLVTLEAAATGIPSIVSDLPGVRTNVLAERTGLVVPPANGAALGSAIERLLSSSEERARLGTEARRRVERDCQWEPLIDQLDAIYRSVRAG
jgi:glycosyltransferase involved in cell wall biosynthesis